MEKSKLTKKEKELLWAELKDILDTKYCEIDLKFKRNDMSTEHTFMTSPNNNNDEEDDDCATASIWESLNEINIYNNSSNWSINLNALSIQKVNDKDFIILGRNIGIHINALPFKNFDPLYW